MDAPKAVVDLVERFDRNIVSYKSANYNETQVRVEFIDPLKLSDSYTGGQNFFMSCTPFGVEIINATQCNC